MHRQRHALHRDKFARNALLSAKNETHATTRSAMGQVDVLVSDDWLMVPLAPFSAV